LSFFGSLIFCSLVNLKNFGQFVIAEYASPIAEGIAVCEAAKVFAPHQKMRLSGG